MPRISLYNPDTHRIEWVDATEDEHAAWVEGRRARAAGAAQARSGSHKPAKARKPTKKQQQQEARAERLEEPATEPGPDQAEGPKQKGGQWHPKSFLAPAYADLAKLGVYGLGRLTYRISRGRAPMRVQEALVISGRALRIIDRKLAKYVRVEFKASEDGEDLAAMAMALGVWAFAALVAAVFKQGAQPEPQTNTAPAGLGAPAQDIPESDLFAGSEPAARGTASATPDPAYAAFPGTAPVGVDDTDLFTGSEPLAPTPGDGSGAGRTQGTPPAAQANGRATGVSDAVWAAVSPTDLGQALEG